MSDRISEPDDMIFLTGVGNSLFQSLGPTLEIDCDRRACMMTNVKSRVSVHIPSALNV